MYYIVLIIIFFSLQFSICIIILLNIYFFIENIIYFTMYKSYYMHVLISITSKMAAYECL